MSASLNWRIQRKHSERQKTRVFYGSKYSVHKGKARVQGSHIRIPSICSFPFSTSAWEWINRFLIVHSGPCQKQSHVNNSRRWWIMFCSVTRFIRIYWIWWANNSPSLWSGGFGVFTRNTETDVTNHVGDRKGGCGESSCSSCTPYSRVGGTCRSTGPTPSEDALAVPASAPSGPQSLPSYQLKEIQDASLNPADENPHKTGESIRRPQRTVKPKRGCYFRNDQGRLNAAHHQSVTLISKVRNLKHREAVVFPGCRSASRPGPEGASWHLRSGDRPTGCLCARLGVPSVLVCSLATHSVCTLHCCFSKDQCPCFLSL